MSGFMEKIGGGLSELGRRARVVQGVEGQNQMAKLYEARREQMQREEEAALSRERQAAMIFDAYQVNQMLEGGHIEPAKNFMLGRRAEIERLDGNPRHTDEGIRMIEAGDIEGLKAVTRSMVNRGVAAGLLELPEAQGVWEPMAPKVQGNQMIVQTGPQQFEARDIVGASATETPMTPYQLRQVELREAQQELDRQKEQRAARELPPDLLKYQIEQDAVAQTAAAQSQNAYRLADSYEQNVKTAGVGAKFDEFIKGITGDEDSVTALRTDYRKLRNTLVLGDLPPGVASDKDIEIAMSGYPGDTAKPEYVAGFLRGMGKLNRFKAAQALYNKNYLSANRTIEQKDRYWKAPIKTSRTDSKGNPIKTNFAEIYWAALESDVPVPQALEILGVNDPNILSKIGY
jgi:hypothetical protein